MRILPVFIVLGTTALTIMACQKKPDAAMAAAAAPELPPGDPRPIPTTTPQGGPPPIDTPPLQ